MGPIIGPLVIAGISVKEENVQKLRDIEVKDSKLLTQKQREFLFKKIIKIVEDYKYFIIEPEEIDNALNSQELNLNKLEAINQAKIINFLKPDKAIIDCPSPNIKSYTNYLDIFLKHKPNIVMEHKADVNYPECSAASIIAKCIREEEVAKLKKKYNIEFGSGYMSDERTQKFLEANHSEPKFDKLFRKSWLPYKNHKLKQVNLLDFKK
ncbi:MAG: ribonuclease HII [Candidatus Nanoarchaeia archaeon]